MVGAPRSEPRWPPPPRICGGTSYYINNLFRGHKATLDRLRVDRWLEEALNRGPDPMHLAAVFGISTASAIRYAQAARQILEDDTTPP
ncbi:hypothetical protein ACFYO0_01230 [Streptomyces sp. NPDC006365]|uniref:hypothetical protein n=1 Tax=Streptomyces sp. NPDC006365 TaxID=3364744 RepID=UPI003681DEDE